MVTIVIPTLWKAPDSLRHTLKSYEDNAHDYPDTEFILIDNSNSDYTSDIINVIKPRKNLGVNPAWNIGVDIAANEHVIIMNDDVTINFKPLFKRLSALDLNNLKYSTITVDPRHICQSETITNNDDDEIKIVRNFHGRYFGFGCFFMIRKSTHHSIPRKWSIFHGDDFIYYVQEHQLQQKAYMFKNLFLPGRFSVTSDECPPGQLDAEHASWTETIEAIDVYYRRLGSPFHTGDLIDDKVCGCTICNCDANPGNVAHCIESRHECCNHEIEI